MVLLVVDTQKGIVDERLYAFEKFVSSIQELIKMKELEAEKGRDGSGYFFQNWQ